MREDWEWAVVLVARDDEREMERFPSERMAARWAEFLTQRRPGLWERVLRWAIGFDGFIVKRVLPQAVGVAGE